MAAEHPEAVFEHEIFRSKEQAAALLRVGEHVATEGMAGPGGYRAARALLLREPPPIERRADPAARRNHPRLCAASGWPARTRASWPSRGRPAPENPIQARA